MIKEGEMIGLAQNRVWFVGNVGIDEDTGEELVLNASSYRPVSRERFDAYSQKGKAVNEDECERLHDDWKDSVRFDRTESSYEDWAEEAFENAQNNAKKDGNLLWFYGQDVDLPGLKLCQDLKLHEQVKNDLVKYSELREEDVASWEFASYQTPAESYGYEKIKNLDWQLIYDMKLVNSCRRTVAAVNSKHTIYVDSHHKYVNGSIRYYDEVQSPKLKGGKNV